MLATASSMKARISSWARPWLPLSASMESPPRETISPAASFWQPMASIVTTQSRMSMPPSRRGAAVISLLFSRTCSCPSAMPVRSSQAPTMIGALPAHPARRRALPSTATIRRGAPAPGCAACARIASARARKRASNSSTGIARMARLNVS